MTLLFKKFPMSEISYSILKTFYFYLFLYMIKMIKNIFKCMEKVKSISENDKEKTLFNMTREIRYLG